MNIIVPDEFIEKFQEFDLECQYNGEYEATCTIQHRYVTATGPTIQTAVDNLMTRLRNGEILSD